ncbi:DUF4382 domain-containing protein [Thalassotalea psychrophila]|uniref:DUF4382 domain-containing protein n=1 Tax=Thalassotalea psychrophila TaxID=3065647 RepID=A0ABY9TXX7_9GAMM|nr:DUF4382 domain-containing protein [Colwelliaceae bacterium SQ149]
MFNNKISYAALMLSVGVGLYSCGGDSSNEPTVSVPFSLGVSDAFVDDAEEVNIEIDKITITSSDGDVDEIDMFYDAESDSQVDTIKINLLDYQGDDQVTIVNESAGIELAVGTSTMELTVIDSGSYVVLDEYADDFPDEDKVKYDIKVPSSRLRLGGFDVVLGATQTEDTPGFTIEFDLTKSLVLRGNDPAKNGFIIKPHGVRIINSASNGTISGVVNLLDEAMLGCEGDIHTVYLYKGEKSAIENSFLADNFDPDFVDNAAPPEAEEPFTSTMVMKDEEGELSYEIGFIPNGDTFGGGVPEDSFYRIAFACNVGDVNLDPAWEDESEIFNDLMIPNPDTQLTVVEVLTGQTVTVDFPVPKP